MYCISHSPCRAKPHMNCNLCSKLHSSTTPVPWCSKNNSRVDGLRNSGFCSIVLQCGCTQNCKFCRTERLTSKNALIRHKNGVKLCRYTVVIHYRMHCRVQVGFTYGASASWHRRRTHFWISDKALYTLKFCWKRAQHLLNNRVYAIQQVKHWFHFMCTSHLDR